MRQLYRIPHPSISITVFAYNGRYIIKLEAGPMEQSYKLDEEQTGPPERIRELLDGQFLQECLAHFNAMYASLLAANKRLGG